MVLEYRHYCLAVFFSWVGTSAKDPTTIPCAPVMYLCSPRIQRVDVPIIVRVTMSVVIRLPVELAHPSDWTKE